MRKERSTVTRKLSGKAIAANRQSASLVSCVVLEMRKPVGPLDRYIEVRWGRAETEKDFEHVV
jgi:hypothetical protein